MGVKLLFGFSSFPLSMRTNLGPQPLLETVCRHDKAVVGLPLNLKPIGNVALKPGHLFCKGSCAVELLLRWCVMYIHTLACVSCAVFAVYSWLMKGVCHMNWLCNFSSTCLNSHYLLWKLQSQLLITQLIFMFYTVFLVLSLITYVNNFGRLSISFGEAGVWGCEASSRCCK